MRSAIDGCLMQVDAPSREEQLVLLEGALGAAAIGMDEVRGGRGGCTGRIKEAGHGMACMSA